LPPIYTPPTAVITSTPATIIVKNTLICRKQEVGTLIVRKEVDYRGPGKLPALSFPVAVSCPPSGINPSFSLANGTSQAVINIPVGTTCTATETLPPPPANVCPRGTVAAWSAPSYTPPSATIAGPPVTITIRNTLECRRPDVGTLIVRKEVEHKGPAPLPPVSFPVVVACPGINTSFSLANGTSRAVINIPVGTSCLVTETLPPPPANACPRGTIPGWGTPSYTPPNPVITPGPPVVQTIKNVLECREPKPAIDLAIEKTGNVSALQHVNNYSFTIKVKNLGDAFTGSNVITVTDTVPSGMTFSAPFVTDWTCNTPPAIPGGGQLVCTYTGVGPTPGQVLQDIFIVAMASGPPPWPPFQNCASVALLPSSGLQDANPQDNTHCVTLAKPGSLIVKKEIENNTPGTLPSNLLFDMTLSCQPSGNTQHVWLYSATDHREETVNFLPGGNTCAVTEQLPPPPNLCPQGTIATWAQPTYTPPSAVIGPTPGTITVKNVLNCAPARQARCDPPLVLNAAGRCDCPEGTVRVGRQCRKVVECRRPFVPNATRTECVCQPGTVRRGNTCVPRLRCEPPAVPNAAGTQCVCPVGYIMRGGECVRVTLPPIPGFPPGFPRDGSRDPRGR
jgi:uncharacterized repeat protein (TIGR01451 family)